MELASSELDFISFRRQYLSACESVSLAVCPSVGSNVRQSKLIFLFSPALISPTTYIADSTYPTEYFTILAPQNPSNDVSELPKVCFSRDLKTRQLRHVWSGMYVCVLS